jgi:hypothetical protein
MGVVGLAVDTAVHPDAEFAQSTGALVGLKGEYISGGRDDFADK